MIFMSGTVTVYSPEVKSDLRAVTLYKQIKGICPGVLIYSPS